MGESGFSQQFSRKITRDLEIPGLRNRDSCPVVET